MPRARGSPSFCSGPGKTGTDGSRTGNIFQESSSGFVDQVTVNGTTYSRYRLTGGFFGSPAITPSNFANVVYEFTAQWESPSGSVLFSRNMTLEIYKR